MMKSFKSVNDGIPMSKSGLPLYALLPLTLMFSTAATAKPAVTLAGVDDVLNCTLIKETDCTSKKMEGLAACKKNLKKETVELDGDTLVITGTEQTEQRKPSLTGVKTVTKTKVTAGIYRCKAEENAVPEKKARAEQSVENRLTRLNKLKEKGLISEEEYLTKRAEILDDL